MVVRVYQINKRNFSCVWIGITKAFDSVSHSWLVKASYINRVPTTLSQLIFATANFRGFFGFNTLLFSNNRNREIRENYYPRKLLDLR